MTVSASEHRQETEETVLDGMIRAGAAMGYGVDDILAEFKMAGLKVDRERVRSIVIPKSRRPSPGALREGRNAAG